MENKHSSVARPLHPSVIHHVVMWQFLHTHTHTKVCFCVFWGEGGDLDSEKAKVVTEMCDEIGQTVSDCSVDAV